MTRFFLLALVLVLAAPVCAERTLTVGAVIAELEKADHALEGANGIVKAKEIVTALLRKLATDPTPSAKWLGEKLGKVMVDLNGGDAHAAHEDIHELEEEIKKPSTLTKAILKAKCTELDRVLHTPGADAVRKFAAAVRAYDDTLGPDFSPLSQWAQERFDDLLKVAATNSVPATAARMRALIAQL